jgi:hypothetical protein
MPHEILSIGMTGGEVSTLHQMLIEQGFSCGEDSRSLPPVFGHATDSAVKLFQASHDGPDRTCLVVDGVVGASTWWALWNPSHSAQGQPGQVLSDMPLQAASNPIAASALQSAWVELYKQIYEIPDGSNRSPKIDQYTGMTNKPMSVSGPPWCAYFVSWNFARAPHGSPFGRVGGAQAIAHVCQHSIPNSVIESPFPDESKIKPGDIAVIANGQDHGHVFHVAAVLNGSIWTVEGNCGNAVRSKKRLISTCKYFINFDGYAKSPGW